MCQNVCAQWEESVAMDFGVQTTIEGECERSCLNKVRYLRSLVVESNKSGDEWNQK